MNFCTLRKGMWLATLLTLFAPSLAHAATLNVPADYRTIQAGIDAARSGDTVLVADGIYTGAGNLDLDFRGKNLTVGSVHGAARTVIDCQGSAADPHRAFYLHSGETARIDGFTLQNGYAPVNPPVKAFNETYGGAVYGGDKVTVTTCTFMGNSAGLGGGVYGMHTITNCTFRNNSSTYGGGIFIADVGSTITNCTFSGNSSRYGGGAHVQGCTITNCTFSGNSADNRGGGVDAVDGSSTITNCTFSGNSSRYGGGGVSALNALDEAGDRVTNCSFSGNSATFGGGVDAINAALANCIFYGDRAATGSELNPYSVGNVTVSHCDIRGGFPGTGNIDADPLFVNAATGDLHLKDGSPCLGRGTPIGAPETDLDGNLRPNPPSMGAYDLGAYDLPASATITAFTVTPNQVTAPGPPTTFEVDTTGEFQGVVVTCDPQNFTGRAPVFALTRNGSRWTGTFPTAFLRLARVNPLPLVTVATRQDGSTATATATLGLQQSLPLLGLSLASNASTVQRNQTVKLTVTVTNPTQAPLTAATLKVSLPAGVTFLSSPNLKPDGTQGLSWSFLLPAGGGFGSGQASTNFVVQVNNNVAANSTLAFTATATAPNFQSASRTATLTVKAGTVPLHVFADESQGFGLLRGEATNVDGSNSPPLQADLTTWAEVTNPLGTHDLQMWFEVVDLRSNYGQTVFPKSGLSPGAVLAGLNLIAPDIHPIYSAQDSFRQVYDTVDMTVMLTPKSFVASLTDYLMAGMAVILPDKGAKVVNVARLGIKLYTGAGAIARIGALWAPPPTSLAAALSAVGKTAKELAGMTDADKRLFYTYAKAVYGDALRISPKQFVAQLSKELNVLQLVKDLADVITWSVQTKGEPMKVRFVATP